MKIVQGFTPVKKVVFSEEVLQDPYPTYAHLLEEGPLHYVDVGSKWAVLLIFSHAECSSAAKDPRLSAKRAQQIYCLCHSAVRLSSANLRACSDYG